MSIFRSVVLFAVLIASSASTDTIPFSNGWSEQKLSLFSSNRYGFGQSLSVTSRDSVSIAWTRVTQSNWQANAASWDWSVETSVPATNLRQKGGDDRNLSLYFVFVPDALAPTLKGANIRMLLGNSNVRVLLYTWGGNHPRGAQFPSPYFKGQGVNVILRMAGTGAHKESVNLTRDFTTAFGKPSGSLVGIAVTGDSDDTDSTIKALISNLRLD